MCQRDSPALPQPRGLSRLEAAAYVGIGGTLFDRMVAEGRLPKPFRIEGRVLWDRFRLDAAIDEMQDRDSLEAEERWRSAHVHRRPTKRRR